MRRLVALVFVIVISLSVVSCDSSKEKKSEKVETKSEQSEEKVDESTVTPLLYKVTHEDGVVWLFGSIHIGVDEMYPLPDYVTDAYESSDALAVECDVIASEKDMTAMMKLVSKMVYTDGTTIKDHISEALYQDSVAIMEESGYYSVMLDYYIPTFWYQTINSLYYEEHEYDVYAGVDRFLINEAYDDEKEIIEIESVEEQYDMLIEMSPELQTFLLADIVSNYNSISMKISTDMMLEAWMDGNEKYFDLMLSEESTALLNEKEQALLEEFNTAMYDERNLLMADFAEDALLEGDNVFICVGAAHVVPEGAMVDILTERGYTVEQVSP